MEVWEKPSGDGPDQGCRVLGILDRRSGSGAADQRRQFGSRSARLALIRPAVRVNCLRWASQLQVRTRESRRPCDECRTTSGSDRQSPVLPVWRVRRRADAPWTPRPRRRAAAAATAAPRRRRRARAPPRSRCGSSGHARRAGHLSDGARGHLVLPMSSAHDKKDARDALLIHPCFYRGPDQSPATNARGWSRCRHHPRASSCQLTLPTFSVTTFVAPPADRVTFTLRTLPFSPLVTLSLDVVAFLILALPAYHCNR